MTDRQGPGPAGASNTLNREEMRFLPFSACSKAQKFVSFICPSVAHNCHNESGAFRVYSSFLALIANKKGIDNSTLLPYYMVNLMVR